MKPPDFTAVEPPAEASLVAVGYGPDRHERFQIVLLADNGVRLGVSRKQAKHLIGRLRELLQLPIFDRQEN